RSWPACRKPSRRRSSAATPRACTASTCRDRPAMLEEPTSLRIDDPGVRTLFTEAARFQSWLDVEAALAEAQAELGIIPERAAREIVSKAHLKYLDLAAVRATFGFKVAVWIDELGRHVERLRGCEGRVFVAMLGGGAGTLASLGEGGLATQEKMAARLGMRPMTVPARTIGDHEAEYVML